MNAAMKEFAQDLSEITISQICNHLPFSRKSKNYVKSKGKFFNCPEKELLYGYFY